MPPWINPYLIVAIMISILLHLMILYIPVLAVSEMFGPMLENEFIIFLCILYSFIDFVCCYTTKLARVASSSLAFISYYFD
jgi:hypothetical protein